MGDGTTTAAAITCYDEEILEQISGDGFSVRRLSYAPGLYRIGGTGHTRDVVNGRYMRNGSLSSRLRNLGLMDGKFIPSPYLEAGTGQRTALLQGLMDTDGYVDDVAAAANSRAPAKTLADGVVELAASLGFRPVKTVGRRRSTASTTGPKYRVKFTPDRPVFRLKRKLARQKAGRGQLPSLPRDRRRAPGRLRTRSLHRGGLAAWRVPGLEVLHPDPQQLAGPARAADPLDGRATWIPGWKGNLTLELSNVANLPIALYFGMKIGQISFFKMSSAVERPYGSKELGSKYQGQSDADGLGVLPRLRGGDASQGRAAAKPG